MPHSPVRDQERHRAHSPSKSSSHERHHRHHRSRRPRSRSRSTHGHERHHKHRRLRSPSPPVRPLKLPYNAKELSRRQMEEYKPLFQSYLDIQKQINIEDLDERELKGRWKSFVGRWNRGELARSWYDPSMLKTAQETVRSFRRGSTEGKRRASPDYGPRKDAESQDEDDDFGPAPPPGEAARHAGHGPTIPKMDDIALRNELREEDRSLERSNYAADMRHERGVDRKVQKERLDELVPRADPGSRERQLEKKRETTSTLKDFRDAKEGGDVDIGDTDLMGDDSLEGYRKQKVEMERQKNEREIRREEIMRARAAEREERLSERRTKEAQTMEYLKAIAKERFG